MADLKKIVASNGTEYEICDAPARARIEALESYSDYLGVTTTELSDGANTNPIVIGGESVTAVKGNIVNYGSKEFIFNGSIWQEFGDLSALGALAYEDSAEVTGTAAAQVFTGTQATIESSLSGGEAQAVVTGIGEATTANIAEFDDPGSVTAGSAASFTQGTDLFTQGQDSFAFTVDANGVGSFTFTQGTDSFTQGSDNFTANTPTAVTLPTSKNTSVVTAQGTATTGSITVPTTASATYTPQGTNAASNISGTAAPAV